MRLSNEMILNALLKGDITTDDLNTILNVHSGMVTLGIKPSTFAKNDKVDVSHMSYKEKDNARHFCLIVRQYQNPTHQDVVDANEVLQNWMKENPGEFTHSSGSRSYLSNKIKLIKKFRDEFNTGLADTKTMIEMMYESV